MLLNSKAKLHKPIKPKAMKTLRIFSALALVLSVTMFAKANYYEQERLNLPGDNLNLYAVMDLFQNSETLEGFERELNAQDSRINNLDLNNDNLIDYLQVIDYPDGDEHTIVIRDAINARETQDVAVIYVYKDKRRDVRIQMIGDEALYGKDYIIEPNDVSASETPNPGYTGNRTVVTTTTYVTVTSWPIVRYVYTPTYVVWRSPWYWDYYPTYWNPWRPYYWDYYYGYHSYRYDYYNRYYRFSYHCNPHYTTWYYNRHRSHSTTVIAYRDNGGYRNTYSRPETRQQGMSEFKRNYPNEINRTGRGDVKSVERTNNRSTSGSVSRPVSRETQQSKVRQVDNNRREARDSKVTRQAQPVRRESNYNRSDSRKATEAPVVRREENRTSTRSTQQVGERRESRSAETRQTSVPSGNRQQINRNSTRSQDRPAQRTEVRSSGNRQQVTSGKARTEVKSSSGRQVAAGSSERSNSSRSLANSRSSQKPSEKSGRK